MCGMFESCEPDSSYYELYESPDVCHETCEAMSFNQATMVTHCLGWAGCGGADSCVAPPEQSFEGCDAYCTSAEELCTDEVFGAASCEDACTGLSMAISTAAPADSAACFQSFDECPEPKESALYPCLVQAPEECQTICNALDMCSLTIDWVCDVFCTTLQQDEPAGYAGLAACVNAAGDCDNMAPCVGQ